MDLSQQYTTNSNHNFLFKDFEFREGFRSFSLTTAKNRFSSIFIASDNTVEIGLVTEKNSCANFISVHFSDFHSNCVIPICRGFWFSDRNQIVVGSFLANLMSLRKFSSGFTWIFLKWRSLIDHHPWQMGAYYAQDIQDSSFHSEIV